MMTKTKRSRLQCWVGYVFLALLLSSQAGCYQRNLAPEVEYSQTDVEKLRNEIEKMEWD